MSPFDWWVLIVGLVAGGTIVALLSADLSRHDADLAADEREAEATFIAAHLGSEGRPLDRDSVGRVLQVHREYLRLPTPDAIVGGGPPDLGKPPAAGEVSATGEAPAAGEPAAPAEASAGDRHPDGEPHEVGHGGGGGADRHLATP